MTKLPLALFISTFLILSTSDSAFAQRNPAAGKTKTGLPAYRAGTKASNLILNPSPTPSPSLIAGAPTPTPAPPSALSRIRLSYFGEVQGPRLSNISLLKTQGPTDADPSYSEWDHSMKLGYLVAKNVVVGSQFGAISFFDPTKEFTFTDIQVFGSWNHMVETTDIDMQGVLKLALPTTARSRSKGRIISVKVQNNWTLKTALRNWSFTASTLINPVFTNSQQGGADMNVGFFPYVTVDLTPNTQFLFEGSFDATHSYNDVTYDFSQGDSDYVNLGPIFNINSHISLTTALRFFTENISFKASCLYFNVSASL